MVRNIISGTETSYGVNGLGSESRWGWDFPHPTRLVPTPIHPPVQ